jgi:hypothetical protein
MVGNHQRVEGLGSVAPADPPVVHDLLEDVVLVSVY